MKGRCLDNSWVTCHFKEPTTFGTVPASVIVRDIVALVSSFLLKFFLHHWTYSVRLGSPLIHSLIIAILRSKFPKVRQCLKWLVFVGAYKFTLCANSGKSWGIPPLRVLETSLRCSNLVEHRPECVLGESNHHRQHCLNGCRLDMSCLGPTQLKQQTYTHALKVSLK